MSKCGIIFIVGAWMLSLTAPCAAIHPPGEDKPAGFLPVPQAEKIAGAQWERLLPENERDHFSTIPPAPLHDYLSGDAAATQTGSAAVNATLEGATIRLPGFIVPLALTAEGLVSEFFLVPYVGACIHVPPPPPNQIVHIRLDKALPLAVLYEAYWVTGIVHTHTSDTRFGAAAYSMKVSKVELYKG
jgi:hypothetical protein